MPPISAKRQGSSTSNLNIPRYVDIFEEEVEIDMDAVQKEIEQLEAELVQVRERMAEMMRKVER